MKPTNQRLLWVDRLSLELGGRSILRDIRLELHAGEFLGLIGPNGGGKTSFLRVLLGVHVPSSGRVVWSGGAGGGRIRRGFVPQVCDPDRACPLGALEVLQQGVPGCLPLTGRGRARVEERAARLLGEVGLGDDGDTRYVDLSGGQQRRLLLARALIGDPEVLLLDEPTAGVDLDGLDQFAVVLRAVAARGVAVILVSHDFPLVTRHADRIACLDRTLHWHGRADALPSTVLEDVFGCEWRRYRARRGRFEHAERGVTADAGGGG